MKNKFWIGITVFATIFATVYLGRSFLVHYQIPPFDKAEGRIDAWRRWHETHYVVRGQNPYDVAFAHVPILSDIRNPSPPTSGRNSDVDPELGLPEGVDYPPWAYPSLMLFFWPGQSHILAYYGACMAAGLVVVAVWSWAQMRAATGLGQSSQLPAVAAMLAAMACAAWGGSVNTANSPPIVIAFLVLAYVLLERRLDFLAGLAIGVALLKPTETGPFLIPLLVTRRWRAMLTAGLVIFAESLITWGLTKTNPLAMLRQMIAASQPYQGAGYGLPQYLIQAGVAPSAAAELAAAVVLIGGVCAMYAIRHSSLFAQFALAAIITRFWAYHLYYDNAILVFVLVFLAVTLQRSRHPVVQWVFLAMCLSLWIPDRLVEFKAVQIFHLLTWAVAGIVTVWIALRLPVDPFPAPSEFDSRHLSPVRTTTPANNAE